ncbi:MAG: radical SAM protein [Bacteroidales bacterium]|jgi:MoaA/NifB/PqqE/SkfB family radical SAM enzyme|nr:radical SAM protein [Bacteroidales bacterium]
MNVYKLLKINRIIKSNRIKLLGILMLHILKKRYFGVFLDPIIACNLQCKMCYFSDENKRKELNGKFSFNDLEKIADKFFPFAIKLQIGCGAEPTMYDNNLDIIKKAKEKHVPYISMTTNGNILKENDLEEYIQNGLDEITISLHGVNKTTYEELMTNACYETFLDTLCFITKLKQKYPAFKVRINYTMNSLNIMELKDFFNKLGSYSIDILQLRPITILGNTQYNDFSWKKIIDNYDSTIGFLKKEAKTRDITIICPSKEDLLKEKNNESMIFDYTYVYISPKEIWQKDFSLNDDDFRSYCKKHKYIKQIIKKLFSKNLTSKEKSKLNYEINI